MAEKTIEVSVVTPSRALFEGTAVYVQVPLYDGLAGIQPGHAPMFARLGPGKLVVHLEGGQHTVFVDGGFLEVARNRVTVLAHNALAIEDIKTDDVTREREELVSWKPKGDREIEERLERMQSVRNRLTLIKK